jgi:phosphatidate cytidylyltransferase
MKQRTISAIFILLLAVPCLILGNIPFALLVIVAGLLGLREFFKIIKKSSNIPLFIEVINYVILLFFIVNNYSNGGIYSILDYRLISSLLLLNLVPLVFINDKNKYSLKDAFLVIGIVLFLGTSFNLAIILRSSGFKEIVYLLLITVCNDTFAYITGMLVGKHHFTDISPNKTIEGCIGGAVMGTLIAAIYYFTLFNTYNVFILFLLTFLISITSQVGDLVFSYIKREYGVKDFSNLIPGHGGILDRLDSIIFAILGFVVFSSIFII